MENKKPTNEEIVEAIDYLDNAPMPALNRQLREGEKEMLLAQCVDMGLMGVLFKRLWDASKFSPITLDNGQMVVGDTKIGICGSPYTADYLSGAVDDVIEEAIIQAAIIQAPTRNMEENRVKRTDTAT